MDVFDLVAKITLDTSGYESSLKSMESKGKTASSGIGSKISSGIGKAAKVAGAALGAAETAVAAFAGSSVRAGAEFDSAMSQVQATMGMTSEEMENQVGEVDLAWGHFSGNLRDYAQEMGRNTAFSATQSAEALNYMALAGYDAQQSMEMLPSVLNLAAAGNMDLATASDMVTDAQTALGLSAEETVTMVDQMAKTASTTNTSVSQLGSAMLTIGGTAKDMKGGTAELSQVLGLLADNGIKASEGGTHLRNMMLKLTSPTKDGAALLEQFSTTLGHDLVFDEKTGEMRSFADIFQDLNVVMGDFTDKQRMQTFSELFNARDLKAANALLGTSKDRWQEVETAIADAQGSAQQMADTQLDNLNGDITLFKSALEGAQIAVSDQLTPSLREFVQFGTDGISKLTDAFDKGGLSGAMDALGEILSDAIAKITEKLPQIVEAGGRLLGSLAEGLIQNMPALLDSAVQIVSDLADAIIEHAPDMIDGAAEMIVQLGEGIADALPELIPKAVEAVTTFATSISEHISEIQAVGFDIISGLATGILDSLPTLIEALPELITNFVNGILDYVPQLIDTGISLITALVDDLPAIIDGLVEAIPEIITGLIDAIVDHIPDIIEAGVKLLGALVQNLPKIIMTIVKAIPKIIVKIVAAILKGVGKIASAGLKLLKGMFSKIGEFFGDIGKAFGKIWDKIKSAVSKFSLVEAGKNLIKGLWNGISSVGQWLWDKISGFFGGIMDNILGFFGIASPSKLMRDKVGKNLALGVGVGFDEEYPDVKKSIEKQLSFDDINSTIGANVSVASGTASVGFTDRLLDRLDGIEEVLGMVADKSDVIELNGRELGRVVRDYA